jgi:hypothetical protein
VNDEVKVTQIGEMGCRVLEGPVGVYEMEAAAVARTNHQSALSRSRPPRHETVEARLRRLGGSRA